MSKADQPFISPTQQLPEITLKVVVLSIILSSILAASNTYLALKIGVLTSASIPAAIISMGILGLFKNSNILENNLVQTAGSAGQAIAGGLVYTIPAMVIIHYWTNFNYLENFLIALTSGILGILLSIPFRRILVTEPSLRFPEGRAIAEVLIAGADKGRGLRDILLGGLAGSVLELLQTGLKVLAGEVQLWFSIKNTILLGFGTGFSAALMGAGYLVGLELGLSLFIGACLGWLAGVPLFSVIQGIPLQTSPAAAATDIWSNNIRFIGLGTMLIGTIPPLFTLFKLILQNTHSLFTIKNINKLKMSADLRTEKDVPLLLRLISIICVMALLYIIFQHLPSLAALSLSSTAKTTFIISCLMYILFFGLIISAVTGYFSGLLGVAASPGSAIMVLSLLTAAVLIKQLLHSFSIPTGSDLQQLSAAAIIILLGAFAGGIAAVAIDNIQDLKVGHIVGATPWKQQLMLLLGVVCSAIVTPAVMELLFQVYGIAEVLPHAGMNIAQSLPAPPAALIATISQGFFQSKVPWQLINIGIAIGVMCILLKPIIKKYLNIDFSPIGVGIGIYLPLSSSMALFIGGLFSWFIKKSLRNQTQSLSTDELNTREERGLILACGLVAGAALMNVLLAIPFSFSHNADSLSIMPASWLMLKDILGIISVALLGMGFYRMVTK
jgi:putative OPT family oligopeptide transporter